VSCDWLERILWSWFYDTRLKTAFTAYNTYELFWRETECTTKTFTFFFGGVGGAFVSGFSCRWVLLGTELMSNQQYITNPLITGWLIYYL